jgi:hypothetical protein
MAQPEIKARPFLILATIGQNPKNLNQKDDGPLKLETFPH